MVFRQWQNNGLERSANQYDLVCALYQYLFYVKSMKSINNNAPVKCSKTIRINSCREKVWSVMTDINNWQSWQTDIGSAKLNGERKAGATFDWKSGGVTIHSMLHTVEPFSYFGWTGKAFGLFAVHNWSLTEKDGQTEVLVSESMEGPLAWLFKGLFNRK